MARGSADSDDTVIVEGNHYFPRSAVHPTRLRPSDTVAHCLWKGKAHYHPIEVDGAVNRDAAWFCPSPKRAAAEIAARAAFWKGVEVA